MYLIVGLGNPEPEYSKTRHNMGFDVINKLAKKYEIDVEKKGFKSLYGVGQNENEKVVLCKPQTYMNLSGEAILEISKFYKIKPSNIIVIYDDIDLPESQVKIRKKGGAGTHNGMKSVVKCIQTEDFPRIRVGTGSPENKSELVEYVIKKMNYSEYEKYIPGIEKAKEAIELILKENIDIAMNRIN